MFKPGRVKQYTLTCLILLLLGMACGPSQTDREVSRMAQEFSAIPSNNTGAYETLLKKYQDRIPQANDEAELIRANILIALGRYNEANKKIDKLLNRQSPPSPEIQLVKVRILVYTNKQHNALTMFNAIEGKLKPGKECRSIFLYFAIYGPDRATRLKYAQKFLDTGGSTPNLYHSMASDARLIGDINSARQHLVKAVSICKDPTLRRILEGERKQLNMLGREAPPLTTDLWLNGERYTGSSSDMSAGKFKGNGAILIFRAPWSIGNQNLTILLNQANEPNQKSGSAIIDCVKLHGYDYGYGESEISRPDQPLTVSEEIKLLREFVRRHKIGYPVAISYEGISFEDYLITALPTFFFIDKDGKVNDFETGAGNPNRIIEKIKILSR